MCVTLSEAEQRLAMFLAKERYRNARNKGLPDKKMGDQSNELTDLEGIAAEIAFCKLANVYPDLDMDHTKAEDCFLRSGKSVDVKSTTYESGRLLAVKWKSADKVDIFALMVGRFPKYRCAGFMKSEDLLKDGRLINLGHGEGYAASQDELEDIQSLLGD